MKAITTLLLVITGIALSKCNISIGSGEIVKEERSVSGFDAINVKGAIEVELSTGDFNVMVEANDNIINDVVAELSGNTLLLYVDRNRIKNAHLKVFITAPDIRKISATSASKVKLMDVLKNTNELTFKATSAAEISGMLDAPKVSIDATSSADIELSGYVRELDIDATSAAEVDAENLKAEIVSARASSAAEIKTFASVELDAKASSAGKILYRGGSTNNKVVTSSGGVIKNN